jgi:hypothetical protein
MGLDGSGRTKIIPSPILDFFGTSPDRRFAVVGTPLRESKTPGKGPITALPVEGGPTRTICDNFCVVSWSPDGKYLYMDVTPPSLTNPAGKTAVIPVSPGDSFPPLPASGFQPGGEDLAIPGIKFVEHGAIAPGLGSTYAYVKATMHANLFRIPLLHEPR